MNNTPAYMDTGAYGTLAYLYTGNPIYVKAAWNGLAAQPWLAQLAAGNWPQANDVREYLIHLVWMYGVLKTVLSAAQKTQLRDLIWHWCQFSLAESTPIYTGGFRFGAAPVMADSDQTSMQYFGLVTAELVCAPDDARFVGLKDLPIVGGFTPSADPSLRASARDCLADFYRLAAGGELGESSEYDWGTPVLDVLGAEMVRTVTGVDYYPEITGMLPAFCAVAMH